MGDVIRLESSTERGFVHYASKFRVCPLKVNRTGWPDRIVPLGHGYCYYIEFKKEGESPRKLQIHIHNLIRGAGSHVYVCDNVDDAKNTLDYEMHIASLYAKHIEKLPEIIL